MNPASRPGNRPCRRVEPRLRRHASRLLPRRRRPRNGMARGVRSRRAPCQTRWFASRDWACRRDRGSSRPSADMMESLRLPTTCPQGARSGRRRSIPDPATSAWLSTEEAGASSPCRWGRSRRCTAGRAPPDSTERSGVSAPRPSPACTSSLRFPPGRCDTRRAEERPDCVRRGRPPASLTSHRAGVRRPGS